MAKRKAQSTKRKTDYVGGFTLAEMLVGVFVFTLIIGTSSSLLISGITNQRKALAFQRLLDEISFAAEYMSRALRMAKKELAAPTCLSQNGLNYEMTRQAKGLKFINYEGVCQEFFLDSDQQLKESKNEGAAASFTSKDFKVLSFNIELSGQGQEDNDQPRITFSLIIEGPEQTQMNLQTTVSQRDLDVRR